MYEVRQMENGDRAGVEEIRALATRELRRVYRPVPTRGTGDPRRTERPLALVALERKQVVGVIECILGPDSLYMQGLAVHPEYRRRGVARALVRAAEALAESESRTKVTLSTIGETGNREIFARLGFTVVEQGPAPQFEGAEGGQVTRVDMCRCLG